MCVYHPKRGVWDIVQQPIELKGVRNHTAHLIDGRFIWFLGGGYSTGLANSVFSFDTLTQRWQERNLSAGQELLKRYGHASVVHPLKKHWILVYGGARKEGVLNDLVVVDTVKEKAWQLQPSNPLEEPRSFASLAAVGDYVFLLGGRTHNSVLIGRERSLQIYCPKTNSWLTMHSGKAVDARSSHKAVGFGSTMLVYGGAEHGGTLPLDVLCLSVAFAGSPSVGLEWTRLPASGEGPAGRTSHSMAIHNDNLYILGGYGKHRSYPGDAWSGSLKTLPGFQPKKTPPKPRDLDPKSKMVPGAACIKSKKSPPQLLKEKSAGPRKSRATAAKRLENDNPGEWRQTKRQRLSPSAAATGTCAVDSSSDSPLHPGTRLQLKVKTTEDAGADSVQRQLSEAANRETELKRRLALKEKQHEAAIVELRNSLQEARNQLAAERALRRDHQTELEQLKESVAADSEALRDELRQEMDRGAAERRELQDELGDARQQVSNLEELNRGLTTAAASGKAEIVRLKHGLEKAALELNSVQKAKAGAQLASDEARRRLEEEVDCLKREWQSCQSQAKALHEKLLEAQQSLQTERQRYDTAEEAKMKLQSDFTRLQSTTAEENSKLRGELAAEQRKSNSAAEGASKASALSERLKAEIERLQCQLADAERKRQQSVEELRQDKLKLTQQLQGESQKSLAIQSQRDTYYNLLQAMRRTLSAADQVLNTAEDVRRSHESSVTSHRNRDLESLAH